MKLNLLLVLLLLSIAANAQNAIPRPTTLQPKRVQPGILPKPKAANNGSRASTVNFSIDYPGADQAYADFIGTDFYYVPFLDVNANYPNTSNLTHRNVIVNFDSLIYDDGSGVFQTIPLPVSQLQLDSFQFYFSHVKATSNYDTIHLSIYNRDSLRFTGSGPGATIVSNTIWDTVIITNQRINPNVGFGGTDSATMMTFYPGLSFLQGKTFGVRIDFAGDTSDKFNVYASFRDDCANACVASPTIAGPHAFYYINATSGGVNLSGINTIAFTCGPPCNEWYMQNVWIYPYITANVQAMAYFATDTFAFCSGNNVLPVQVYGGAPPFTYAWSPTYGLSDSTSGSPLLSNIFNPITYTVTVTDFGGSTFTASVLVTPDTTYCSAADQISGYVYLDNNNNAQFDAGDHPYQNALISVDGSAFHLTDSTGLYTLRLPQNASHTIALEGVSSWSWFTEPAGVGSYTIFPGINQSNVNFGVHVSPDTSNGRVQLISVSTAPRPGFWSDYIILLQNTIGGALTGELQLKYDSHQSFSSSTPAPDNVNVNTRTVSWNITNMPGGSQADFHVELRTSTSAQLNNVITNEAVLLPNNNFKDRDSLDNKSLLTEIVIGSYDPNDKSVSPVDGSGLNRILPDQELTYTIRFQNTGTFYAENVSVSDTIDTDLDMNTFQMIAASHSYSFEKNGNKLVWHFYNIMLPDSNTNEPESHGYIVYKIKPKQTVSDFSAIQNTAYIYFDYNEAIVTNTTSNLVDFHLPVSMLLPEKLQVSVYPNPFSSETIFSIVGKADNLRMLVTDAVGKVVSETVMRIGLQKFNATGFAKGLYTYTLLDGTTPVANGKFSVQ